GAASFAESMNVAKFVISRASPDRSRPNSAVMVAAIAASAAASLAGSRLSMASQNRRWSVTATGTFVNRGPAVVAHHCCKPSLLHGATTRLAVARARHPDRRAGVGAPRAAHLVDRVGYPEP